ncbi:MAG: TIGR01212 family radical SAM protein [Bacteroidetes bacterium]|jgi:radical SAM protein (TIGR01212 family)|nr:TIGR01212 family radical SAM protein [Bacteroidota bacterium]
MVESTTYKWGNTRRFNAYSNYFRSQFGERVQKLSINAGFTCPNRDGKVSTGGCTYCNNQSFQPAYCQPSKSISEQIQEGISFHRIRYRNASKFLAYFQSYSNTYKPLSELKNLYGEALSQPGVIGLIIGTRPDCVDEEKLNYLAELSRQYYVVLEYGIESVYNQTLQTINRGHDYEIARIMVEKTAGMGIRTSAHFIIGLPGEGSEKLLNTASVISKLPLHTVKFHQLQIVKGSQMEIDYLANPTDFHLFSLHDYLNILVAMIERLNPDIIVERIAGEVSPDYQVNKGWAMRSDQVTQLFENKLKQQDTWQGKYYQ